MLALTVACLFGYGTSRSYGLNDDVAQSDQSAYLGYASGLALTPGQLIGDRNRMPIYPWLLATIGADGTTPDAFARAKQASVVVSALGLIGLGLWANRHLGRLGALAFVASASASVFVFKAPFAQPEPFFYLVFFATCVLMAGVLVRPRPIPAAIAGMVAGFAFLTKSSALPLIALFIVALLASAAVALRARAELRPILTAAGSFVLLLAATIAPYTLNSWRAYGQPLYNTNSSLYAWTDSWDESSELPLIWGAYVGDPDERPSRDRYLAEHGLGDILRRLTSGLGSIETSLRVRSLAGPMLAVQLGAVVALARGRRGLLRTSMRKQPVLAGFIVATIGTYLLSIAWWAPQATGPRFVLTLYLPVSAGCLYAVRCLGDSVDIPRIGTDGAALAFAVTAAAAIAALVAASLVFAGSWYGGA